MDNSLTPKPIPMKDQNENSKSEIEKQAEEVERVAFAKMLPPNSEDKGVQKGAPLATDNTLPETISKSDGSGTIEIHPEVKKLAIAWIENYTPNGSIMPEIAQKFKLAEDIQRILDTQGEQERQKVIQECIEKIDLDAREIRQISEDRINTHPSTPMEEFKRGMIEMRAIAVSSLKELEKLKT